MIRRPLDIPVKVKATIADLHPETRRKVRAAIDNARVDPEAGEPLVGELVGNRKIVLGDWRIVFRLEGRTIRIVAVGRRASVYIEAVERLQKRVEERRARYRRRARTSAKRSRYFSTTAGQV